MNGDVEFKNSAQLMPLEDKQDIDTLHAICMRHAQQQDGLDTKIVEAVQTIQQTIMMRAGGRCYSDLNQANGKTDKK